MQLYSFQTNCTRVWARNLPLTENSSLFSVLVFMDLSSETRMTTPKWLKTSINRPTARVLCFSERFQRRFYLKRCSLRGDRVQHDPQNRTRILRNPDNLVLAHLWNRSMLDTLLNHAIEKIFVAQKLSFQTSSRQRDFKCLFNETYFHPLTFHV